MPGVSVIVPAFNAGETLGATLRALSEQDLLDPFEVIVVDDGSDDETVAVARAATGGVKVLEQRNEGPGAARNRGAREAGGTVLAFTDADCVPATGWLAAGVAALDGADLVQGTVSPDPEVARRPFDRTVWVGRETGLYECASLFVRRDAFEAVGGFEDWLGARLGKELAEDAWLGWRIRESGRPTAFAAGAEVRHAVFRRGIGEFVAERLRLVYFPAIVRKMPGLRRSLLRARVFISWRAAAFDLGLVGAAVAALGQPLAAVATAPYLWIAVREAGRWRGRAPQALVGEVAADAVGLAALLVGSARNLTLII